MPRASAWKLIGINMSWLGLSFMWNSLHVLLLPALLLNFVSPDRKNTVLGLLTGLGLIIAMLIQPISGALSDRWVSRWGRRRPLIVAGTLGDVIFLGVMGILAGLPGIAIGYIGLQLTSNISHGAMQGILSDELPSDQIGRGSAIKTVMDMLGLVISSIGMGYLISPVHPQALAPTILIVFVLLAATAITLISIGKPKSLPILNATAHNYSIMQLLRIDFRQHKDFAWLIVSRLAFLLGVYGIQAFAQYYVRDTLAVSNPVQLTGQLMAVIVLGLVVCSLVAGFLCDRYGPRLVHLGAALLVTLGSLLMATAHTSLAVLVYGTIIGAGIGLFLTANWTLANRLAPADQAGKFLGLTNLATAGAGAISRLFGPAIDGLNNARPGVFFGYTALFICSAVFATFGYLILANVFKKQPETIQVE